ncbi:MAG: hypothetical protein CL666_13105 [Balneola sp.]|nr:hypothetical protein [Balneola sp.]|tara:strand:- start:24744 stop:26384 length:1641 start_codon:yes stop_codon:yes gene_type:complete
MTKKGKYRSGLLAAVVLMASVGIAAQQTDIYFLIKKNFSIFSKAYETVALEYVDEVDPEILMRTGIDAMLETLDPYTVMFSESQNEQAEIMSRGNYAGIGIEAGFRDGEVVVVAPRDGGPAAKAGIRAGDVIVAVDGVSTENLQPEEVNTLTQGEIGSEITITIRRFGIDQPIDFTLTRENIEVTNISYSGFIGDESNTGYIRLSQFGSNSGEEVREAMLELMDNDGLNGLVLDLRDNPGGILQEAVKIIDKFIEPGITVVDIRGRSSEFNQAFTTRESVMFEKPVIVLMNGGSASASEVVAGALQDLDRGLIIGEQSFGKGLVQVVRQLPYNTSLKITISRYYIPSGRSIQSVQYTHQGRNAVVMNDSSKKEFKTRNGRTVYEGRGIEPDVAIDNNKPNILEVALLQQGLYFDFATKYEAEHSVFDHVRLPDEVFNNFREFLEEQEFSYQTDAEKMLAQLSSQLEEVDTADQQLQELEKAIDREKELIFEDSEADIRRNLFLELTSRYQGQAGRVEAGLKSDSDIIKALEFIQNSSEIDKILRGE